MRADSSMQRPTLPSRQHASTSEPCTEHWQRARKRLWQRCRDWCTGTQDNVVVVVEQIEEECTRQLEQIITNMQDTSTTLNQAHSKHTPSTLNQAHSKRIPFSQARTELTGRVQADVAYGVADAILKAEDQEVNSIYISGGK